MLTIYDCLLYITVGSLRSSKKKHPYKSNYSKAENSFDLTHYNSDEDQMQPNDFLKYWLYQANIIEAVKTTDQLS